MSTNRYITREELRAELEVLEADLRARALKAPYTALFRAATEASDTGGGGVCMRLLLSLYNGERFKFDLTDLRRLDAGLHAAAVAAMQDEVGFANYVHDRIATETGFPACKVQAALEWLAYDFKLPGRVKKEHLSAHPGYFEFGGGA